MDPDVILQSFDVCRFHHHMRKRLELVEPGHVRVHLPWFPELDQGMGMIHGGVYAALLDTASYYAALTHYGPMAKLPLTQEYKINLLASVREEDLVADSTVLKAGGRVAVVETKISSASGKLVAVGLTSLVIRA